ncbi:MAG TPA: hypothetical protein VMW85_04760 [Methanomassiliicoccales archaeon]|nr:hypothetical protein [Methanomassiliicoccales archaeon]
MPAPIVPSPPVQPVQQSQPYSQPIPRPGYVPPPSAYQQPHDQPAPWLAQPFPQRTYPSVQAPQSQPPLPYSPPAPQQTPAQMPPTYQSQPVSALPRPVPPVQPPVQYSPPAPQQAYPSVQTPQSQPPQTSPVISNVGPSRAPLGLPALLPQIVMATALRPNERPMQIWRAGLEMPNPNFNDDQRTPMMNGLLLATDQRLAFVEEKGIFSKTYMVRENIEFGQIYHWQLHRFMRMKTLQVDLMGGHGGRKIFQNIYEVDPMTMRALNPLPAEQVQGLLETLIRNPVRV